MKPLREFTTGTSPAPAILECQNIQQDPPENSQVCEKGKLQPLVSQGHSMELNMGWLCSSGLQE